MKRILKLLYPNNLFLNILLIQKKVIIQTDSLTIWVCSLQEGQLIAVYFSK
jgi:hypothetical protein